VHSFRTAVGWPSFGIILKENSAIPVGFCRPKWYLLPSQDAPRIQNQYGDRGIDEMLYSVYRLVPTDRLQYTMRIATGFSGEGRPLRHATQLPT
jgi:hypothetical protein